MADSKLLSVAEALKTLLAGVNPVNTERVSIIDSHSRVLGQDIVAHMDLPPFSNSSMDGFVVRADDVRSASSNNPIELEVVGDISAGRVEKDSIGENQAMRIMTGGVLPKGADAVVPVEYTDNPESLVRQELGRSVRILQAVQKGDFIRLSGQDVHKGSEVLGKGRFLRPQDIGMLAALGIPEVEVFRQPRVAVISTGDELLDVGVQISPGAIFDSNGYALNAAIESSGGIPIRIGIVPDDPILLQDAFERSVQAKVDLILSSAGVSMGAYDFVRTVIEKHGHLEFWKVNIRPGKPILMGSYQNIPILGLPGNPVSALVTFEIFVRPFIQKLGGVESERRISILAYLKHDVESDGRESYLRAKVSKVGKNLEVHLVGSQDSGVLSSLVEANALIRIPSGRKHIPAGEIVEVWVLRQDGML